MDAERRNQLLAGYSLDAITKGDKPCWTDVRSAPKWVQDRVVEVRAAIVEKRAVPAYAPGAYEDAELRARLAAVGEQIKADVTAAARQDAELRARLAAIGAAIKAEAAEAADDEDAEVCATCGQRLRSEDAEDDEEQEDDEEKA